MFDIFARSIADLSERLGMGGEDNFWADPEIVENQWQRRRGLLDHLARTAYRFWVAEEDGKIIGYARATMHDGIWELTEYFVLPGSQSAGLGRELFERTLPDEPARHRIILATTDVRAQARYLKSGVYPRFSIQYLYRKPETVQLESDLVPERIHSTPETVAALGEIDQALFDFRRDPDHLFLLNDREAYLWRRDGQPVGYSYFGNGTGPMAVLNEDDMPALIAHAERAATAAGAGQFGMELPMINRAAVDWLLGRGYRIEPFVVLGMTDSPFGKFENYICTSPPFFM